MDKRKEIDFDYQNRPYTFVDLETGTEIKLHPSDISTEYQRRTKALTQTFKVRCAKYGIDLVPADIASGFDQILRAYIDKRNSMR